MNRRTFLSSAAAAAMPTGAQRRPPNIIFFLSDDLGYGDLGCYGSKDIRTPNIDRIAREGVRFTDCYSNAPVCTPTRVGFLTGRYQQRFGPDLEWALSPLNNKTAGLMPQHTVLPRALKQAGYASGVFGKWHVGWNPAVRPLRHGFDEFFGILLGNADMYTHKYHDNSDDLWEGDQPVKRTGYLTEMLGERAASFVDKNANRPFFCYVPFNAVHWPFQPPGKPEPRSAAMWRDGERSEYVAMTESMDQAVGHVLDTVRRRGQEENTIVVFTNDNGGERLSESGGFFHAKSTLFEGGIRVPGVMRWPGVIRPGMTSRQVCTTMDFTRTFLSAAGVAPPDGIKLDGIDLTPVVSAKQASIDRTMYWRIRADGRRQLAARRGRWKYIDDNTGNRNFPELLFDLEADPWERKNIFYSNQKVAADLRASALAWDREVG